MLQILHEKSYFKASSDSVIIGNIATLGAFYENDILKG